MLDINTNNKLLIIGCGGHSKVVTDIAKSLGIENIIYLDPNFKSATFKGRNVLKDINKNYNGYFFVAIGDNFTRNKIYLNFLKTHKYAKECPPLIHPTAYFSKSAELSKGSVVMPQSAINSDVSIGKGVIINTSSVIEHDCILEDFSSVAPGVNIGGNTHIGYRSAISIGSTIKHGINIGSNVVVGASSLVLDNISDDSLSYGVPSRFIKKRSNDSKYL
tara:strand:+ start:192 stop:848 length:657 start_codon:yes stop_codon:yes gene_type:complete